MNRLKNTLCYLAGPIDRAHDLGTSWRQYVQEVLWELGVGVLNPCDKPTDAAPEDEASRAYRQTLKNLIKHSNDANLIKRCYDELHNIMKDIVAYDLRMVDIAHFVILHVDTSIHMCGSYNEQTHACLQRKPVIVQCQQGKVNIPDWLFGICNHNMFFDSWDEVEKYLNHVAFDEDVSDYNRWRFFNFDKIYNTQEVKPLII